MLKARTAQQNNSPNRIVANNLIFSRFPPLALLRCPALTDNSRNGPDYQGCFTVTTRAESQLFSEELNP